MSANKLILIVDDEESIRLLLQGFLEEHGYRVLSAADGAQAIALAEQHVPDLVITDLLLQKEHGIDVVRTIKDRLFIPVIAVSGIYREEEVRRELHDFEIDAYLAKPVPLPDLLRHVQTILHE